MPIARESLSCPAWHLTPLRFARAPLSSRERSLQQSRGIEWLNLAWLTKRSALRVWQAHQPEYPRPETQALREIAVRRVAWRVRAGLRESHPAAQSCLRLHLFRPDQYRSDREANQPARIHAHAQE